MGSGAREGRRLGSSERAGDESIRRRAHQRVLADYNDRESRASGLRLCFIRGGVPMPVHSGAPARLVAHRWGLGGIRRLLVKGLLRGLAGLNDEVNHDKDNDRDEKDESEGYHG
jgi:hypothetical protein